MSFSTGFVFYAVLLMSFIFPYGLTSFLIILFFYYQNIKLNKISLNSYIFFFISIIFIICYFLLSLSNNANLDYSIEQSLKLFLNILILFVSFYSLQNKNSITQFCKGIISSSSIICVFSLFNYIIVHYYGINLINIIFNFDNFQATSTRLIGTVKNPNNFAFFISLPLMFQIYLLQSYKKIKYYDLTNLLILLSTLILTGSRGIIIPFILVSILFLFRDRRHFTTSICIVFFIYLFLMLFYSFFRESPEIIQLFRRITLIDGLESLYNNQIRHLIFLDYLHYFKNNFFQLIFGHGFQNYYPLRSPDNSILLMIYRYGLISTIVLISFFIYHFFKLYKYSHNNNKFTLLIIMMFVITCCFINDWIETKTFWLFLAINYIFLRNKIATD